MHEDKELPTNTLSTVYKQAFNLVLEGAQQFSSGKGHFDEGKCQLVFELW